MHEFVRTLAGRLASPGVAVRAQNVFDQAMDRGAFRWGRRARLVAGAALAEQSAVGLSLHHATAQIQSFDGPPQLAAYMKRKKSRKGIHQALP